MKLRTLAYALAVGCALGAGSASAEREGLNQNSVTSVNNFVHMWQQRIVNENLPVADASTWALRNMPKFASFSAERLELARRASSLGELEALLATAPIANGTSLEMLMATKPGNISLDGFANAKPVGAVLKNDPTTTPTAYSDLVFTALNPCRISDSRVSQGGAGPFINGVARNIDFGPRTGYSFQGGSATNCGVPTLVGSSQIAAVMFAVSSFSQTAAGYLTFWPGGAPDPSATVVSMFYTAGPVQTAFVVAPTDLVSNVFVQGIARGANTEVTTDIVGYFAKPRAAALDCQELAGTPTTIPVGPSFTTVNAPACAAGYTRTSIVCDTSNFNTTLSGYRYGSCFFSNTTATGPHTGTATTTCCRTPGR